MKTALYLPPGAYEELLEHLLPLGGTCEEAAFLLASAQLSAGDLNLSVVETVKLAPTDFAARYADYLELADGVRGRVIKLAHDRGACLIEVHSHVGPWRASFSFSDIRGLKETVPHMWWRLKGRPYGAIVVARDGLDALVWVKDPEAPMPLNELWAGDRLIRPSCTTWEEWS